MRLLRLNNSQPPVAGKDPVLSPSGVPENREQSGQRSRDRSWKMNLILKVCQAKVGCVGSKAAQRNHHSFESE